MKATFSRNRICRALLAAVTALAAMIALAAWGLFSSPRIAHAAEQHSWTHDEPYAPATPLSMDSIANYYNLTEGQYYLTGDLELAQTITVSEGSVELCLNGFRITAPADGSAISVTGGALTVYDCEQGECQQHVAEPHKGEITGAITQSNIDYGNGSAIIVNNSDYKDATFILHGGTITGNGMGIYATKKGKVLLYGGNISNSEYIGIYLYDGGILEMSDGEISENSCGVELYHTMIGNCSATFTGGRISGNQTGVEFPGQGVTLGGTPYIKDNYDSSTDETKNISTNGVINLLEDFNGEAGVYLTDFGSPFTSGYKEGMENCFTLDNAEVGRIKPVEVDSYDDDLQQPVTVTELAVTNHIDFMLDGNPVDGISSDYVKNSSVFEIIYTYDEEQNQVMREEFAAALIKPSDGDYHYTFSQFLKESGEQYYFDGNDRYTRLSADIEVSLEFNAEEHVYPQGWQEVDKITHKKVCSTCGFDLVAEHEWGENEKAQDGTVYHDCALCGAHEEFVGNSDVFEEFFNSFDDITGSGGAAEGAKSYYDGATDEEKQYLDEAAKSEGYSGFSGLVEDMEAKAEFEADKEETLANLDSTLRGCDGKKVRDELSLTIENVNEAVYERCTDDDYRLNYLTEQKNSLAERVSILQNIRAQERAKSALKEYLNEKKQSGCYSQEAIDSIAARIGEIESGLEGIDISSGDASVYIAQFLSGGMEELDSVRAEAVVAGGKTLDEAVSGEYAEQSAEIYGYLSRRSGFNGNSKLTLTSLPQKGDGLLGGRIRLTGDNLYGARVFILLPESARGYGGYYITLTLGESRKTVFAEEENGVISFEIESGGSDVTLVDLPIDTDAAQGEAEFTISAVQKADYTWLIVLIACLSTIALAASGYVLIYFLKGHY